MHDKYVMDAATGQPVPCDDLLAWARWFETADRRVALTSIPDPLHAESAFEVSTVFLGLDHDVDWFLRLSGVEPHAHQPVLWETLVFCDKAREDWLSERLSEYDGLWGTMQRYTSREEALAGHERMVHAVRAALLLDQIVSPES